MRGTNFIEAVVERDIDLLLLEEMHVSTSFRSWLIKLVYGTDTEIASFEGAWHSFNHPVFHEADLVFLFKDSLGHRCAILIENKIDAPSQPEQGFRYTQHGEAGASEKRWDRFRTSIAALQRYLIWSSDAGVYDVQITYESIRDWFTTSSSDSDRSTYRARLINEAIEQNRRGYQSKPDAVMTRFCSQYWAYVVEEFPELKMDDPGLKGIPSRSDWRYLKNPALGKGRHLIHKWPQGVVDLQIDYAGDFVDEIQAANRAILVDGIDVVNTGKSASIQIQVPAVNWRSEFAGQKEAVRAGLAAAVRLLVISPKIAWQRQKDGNKR